MLIRKTPTLSLKRKVAEGSDDEPLAKKTASEKESVAADASLESETRITTAKLDPFDEKHRGRVTVVNGNKKKSDIVYKKCRFDANGVMSVEEISIEQKDRTGQCSNSKFDGLVLKKYKKGENEFHRVDAKGKLQQRFSFFIRLTLLADFLFALKKVWGACKPAKLPNLQTILKTPPNEHGEVDISNASENIYTNEICQ